MIYYPASSVFLSSDELDYISGGSSSAGAALSVVGAMIAVVNAMNVISIKHELRENAPEKSNIPLTFDAYNAYMETPYGSLMMISSMVLLVGGIIL